MHPYNQAVTQDQAFFFGRSDHGFTTKVVNFSESSVHMIHTGEQYTGRVKKIIIAGNDTTVRDIHNNLIWDSEAKGGAALRKNFDKDILDKIYNEIIETKDKNGNIDTNCLIVDWNNRVYDLFGWHSIHPSYSVCIFDPVSAIGKSLHHGNENKMLTPNKSSHYINMMEQTGILAADEIDRWTVIDFE